MGINDNDSIFLTQEEQDVLLLSQTEIDEEESDQKYFENAITEFHRWYNLRNKKSTDNPIKKTPNNSTKKTADTFAKKIPDIPPKKNTEVPTKKTSDIVSKRTQIDFPSTSEPNDISQKDVVEKQDVPNTNKTQTSFNIENELGVLAGGPRRGGFRMYAGGR